MRCSAGESDAVHPFEAVRSPIRKCSTYRGISGEADGMKRNVYFKLTKEFNAEGIVALHLPANVA